SLEVQAGKETVGKPGIKYPQSTLHLVAREYGKSRVEGMRGIIDFLVYLDRFSMKFFSSFISCRQVECPMPLYDLKATFEQNLDSVLWASCPIA
ncbi:hypothetical protein PENTCL1PPCAC_20735, partial [Pristionchus entomophagus]